MNCPICSDTVMVQRGMRHLVHGIMRRVRLCKECGHRVVTYEILEEHLPKECFDGTRLVATPKQGAAKAALAAVEEVMRRL
jgi:transcriptional regulator NrdR family protein